MSSQTIESGCHDTATPPASVAVDVRRLTTAQLRVLGLSRVAYLRATRSGAGTVDYVIHGADGVAVAAVDELDLARDLVGQLGLLLLRVH